MSIYPEVRHGDNTAIPGAPLTPRERQVLALVAQGLTAKEMGRYLGGLSSRTMEIHRHRVVAKLRARNMTHAAAIAVRDGIIDLDEVVSPERQFGASGKKKLLPSTPIVGELAQRNGKLS
jgi:DNA-binding CsgD family transcriptional regulator